MLISKSVGGYTVENANRFDRTLLVVDDSTEMLAIFRIIADIIQINLLTAKNAEDALRILRSCDHPPEIMLVDLTMPGMSGIEFLKIVKLEGLANQTHISVMSAHNETPVEGADGWLKKPFSLQEAFHLIENSGAS
jgi:CheY-like chemotaxis protein